MTGRSSQGDPDTLVVLTSTRTEFEGSAKVVALEAAGIPARMFGGASNTLQWEGGYTDPIKVMVRRADVERAAAVLAEVRQDSVDIDWSQVDVGDRVDPPDAFPICPACGYDRGDIPAGQPCPECGYAGVAQNRARATRRPSWRIGVRRIGFILIGAAFLAAGAANSNNTQAAIPILIIAIVMILWGYGGGKPAPRRSPVRGPRT